MSYGFFGGLVTGLTSYLLLGESILAGVIGAIVGYGAGDYVEKHNIGQATPNEVTQKYKEYA